MSQFSSKKSVGVAPKKGAVRKTVNRAGGDAFTKTPEIELAQLLLTFKMNEGFYRSAADTVARLRELVGLVDPAFAARAALYARHEMGMRSTSHIVAAEVAFCVSDKSRGGVPAWTAGFLDKVCRRTDDPVEILSCYIDCHGKTKVTNAMRNGLGKALSRFDEYQLAKYRGDGKAMSLIDAVNLLHPPHTAALAALIKGTLPAADTWETRRSAVGQTAVKEALSEDAKAEALSESWRSLVETKKLGYFAAVRNIVTIGKEAPDLVDSLCEQLTDAKAVAKSLLWPYHFYLATKAVQGATGLNGKVSAALQQALSTALDLSVSNIPEFEGNTLVAVDFSASMDNPVSTGRKGGKQEASAPSLTCREAGALMGVSLAKSTAADLIIFGTTATYAPISPVDSIAGQVKWLTSLNRGLANRQDSKYEVGHGTSFDAIFRTANQPYDRVFIFSDMQGWLGNALPACIARYTQAQKIDPKIFMWDLVGYETSMLPGQRIVAMAGFSSSVFDAIKAHDESPVALVKKINEIVL